MRCIVDTDAGPDDLMALAYLLATPEVHIEAITTAYGLAHTRRAAENILRVLALCDRDDIPVYVGADAPLVGTAAFPVRWRRVADELPGIRLPRSRVQTRQESAAAFLWERLLRVAQEPVHILTLGALTNLAAVCAEECPRVKELVTMGGAFGVSGNVVGGASGVSSAAEWNIHVDPLAAKAVFSSGVAQRIVTHDAALNVPITFAFASTFRTHGSGPLHRLVCELLDLMAPHVSGGTYYAWDPLAAVALMHPGILSMHTHAIEVLPNSGVTRVAKAGPPKAVAMSADHKGWEAAFLSAFT